MCAGGSGREGGEPGEMGAARRRRQRRQRDLAFQDAEDDGGSEDRLVPARAQTPVVVD